MIEKQAKRTINMTVLIGGLEGAVKIEDEGGEAIATRRGLVLHKHNPFMAEGVLIAKTKTKRVTNKRGDMMVMGETGEIVSGVAGFWQAQEVDATQFIKLFVQGVKAFKDLTGSGTKVFEVLYLEMQKNINQDRIFIAYATVDQTTNPMSETTYTRGMRELVAKGFLAASPIQGWFWINPSYMWNGDRLAFVKEWRKKGPKVDPRQRALPLEEVQPVQ
jgi:hypothetical protein